MKAYLSRRTSRVLQVHEEVSDRTRLAALERVAFGEAQLVLPHVEGLEHPREHAIHVAASLGRASLENDLTDNEGWMFGGIENDADRRRVRRASEKVIKELLSKGAR